jgi:uncharacterized protein
MSDISFLSIAFLILLITTSVAIWCVIIARWNENLPALPHRDRNPVKLSAGVAISSAIAWMLFQQLASDFFNVDSTMSLARVQSATLANVTTVLFVVALLGFRFGIDSFRDLGLTTREPVADVVTGVLGFVGSLLPVFAVIFATAHFRSESEQHVFLQFLRSSPTIDVIAWIAVAVSISAPLAEELLFRVILQGSLQTRMDPRIAIGISSLIFAAVHRIPDSIALIPLGLILGYIYYQRNSYLAVVLVHALFNLVNVVLLLLSLE